jgi:hypothetical protein
MLKIIMKKYIVKLLLLTAVFIQPMAILAVHVNGYYRSNGTYVNSYERSAPDSSPYNNYGYPGNYNPNTGSITGGNADTYLNNYYNKPIYTPPTYYPTTPTCPSNSYSSGSSCKCNYGYSVSGSSCVSDDSICQNQLGYNSSYDSSIDSCKCSYGYVIGSSGQCVNGNSYCSSKIGIMSSYSSYSKKCECDSGYEFDGSVCSTKTEEKYAPVIEPKLCPINSYVSITDPTKCLCNYGYQNNSSNDGCVVKPVEIHKVEQPSIVENKPVSEPIKPKEEVIKIKKNDPSKTKVIEAKKDDLFKTESIDSNDNSSTTKLLTENTSTTTLPTKILDKPWYEKFWKFVWRF